MRHTCDCGHDKSDHACDTQGRVNLFCEHTDCDCEGFKMMSKSFPKFYHEHDPMAPDTDHVHYWHFVYIHGKAEDDMGVRANLMDWEWAAPDLFVSDQVMPTEPGEYEVNIYGKKAIAVLAMHRFMNVLTGRVAYENDVEALAHCRKLDDWR